MRFAGKPPGPVGFREALFAGLAPDGSLYRPVEKPDLSQLFASFDARTSFVDLAARVSAALLAPEIDAAVAHRIAERAFTFSPVLRRLDERRQLLELFHGPTCAFKDFGAQFLAASMEAFVETEGGRIQVLVATSGDTGSAVAHAFHGRAAIDVVILYPSGRVSELQEKQLTTLGGNVHALEVDGSFDDCQRLAKAAFQDPELARRLRLTSANSINIGRLLPQAFSYVWAAAQAGTRVPAADAARRPARGQGLPMPPGSRVLRAERQLRPPDRRGVRVALGPARGSLHRRHQRERRGPPLPRKRPVRSPRIARHPVQRDGRRKSQQLRAARRCVRR